MLRDLVLVLWRHGLTDTTRNPSHSYGNVGSYTVTLYVENAVGDSTCAKELLRHRQPRRPLVSVSASSSSYVVAPGRTTTVAATATDSQGHNIVSWSWSDGGAGGAFADPTAGHHLHRAQPSRRWGSEHFPDGYRHLRRPTPVTAPAQPFSWCGNRGRRRPSRWLNCGAGETFQIPFLVSVNPIDGSCWVGDYGTGYWDGVMYLLDASGNELVHSGGFESMRRMDSNPADGSCWVSNRDLSTGKVSLVHVARDGSWLWQGESLAQYLGISSVSVNKADGSVWLTGCCDGEGMLHVAEDGTELARLPWAGMTLAVNPSDGSYWVSNQPALA